MKKTLTKFLAIVLSVCVLLSTPVFAALAESYCPIESVSVTLNRPMYEGVDGYWEYTENGNIGDFFYYDMYGYLYNAGVIHLNYKDGTTEKLTMEELSGKNDLAFNFGYGVEDQFSMPWEVGMEIPGWINIKHEESERWIINEFNMSIEENPVDSITAEATKSLVENISGEAVWDENDSSYYRYNPALTEPTFTIKWKDSSKADSVVAFSEVENILYTQVEFSSEQSAENEWVAGGPYTATASIFGVECDFEVSVISLDVTSISAKATNKAILNYDTYGSIDTEVGEPFQEYYFDRFFPEITLNFADGRSVNVAYENFNSKTNNKYSLSAYSNQSSRTPWTQIGNYNFTVTLSVNDNPDFEPLTCTMPVEIIESPIEKITAVATQPINVNNYEYYENGEHSYKYYLDNGSPLMTLYYTDGTVSKPMYWYEIRDLYNSRYWSSISSDQGYGNEWELGKHKCNASFMGSSCDYDVYVSDCVVKSIKVLSAKVNDDNGYYDENGNYNYYTNFDIELEFTLWDDSKVVKTMSDGNWCEYGGVSVEADQQSNPWYTGGENEFTVTFNDNWGVQTTATGNAEIIEYFEFDYIRSEDGLVIDGFYGKAPAGVLEIPEEIYGEPVVAISSLSSYDGKSEYVKSIVIPDSVLSISDYILSSFSNLESIEIGSGALYIPDGFGAYNENLKTLTVSSENADYYSVNNAIFTKDKTKLVAVAPACTDMIILPAECTDISIIYNNASAYENIKIGYETAGDYIAIENGITYTKDKKTVLLCDKEKSGAVVLPNTVTSIVKQAFSSCDKITSVTVPNGVTEIVYGTFSDCTSLKSITLSNSLKTIESWAFAGCTSLTSVKLPETLKDIESCAFRETGLTSLTIPNSVENIGKEVFTHAPIETAKLGSGLKTMRTSFYECEKLKSVNIPAGIESFDGAFLECSSLSSVTLENGLKSISKNAFGGCAALTSINIPSSVVEIRDSAFCGTGLKSVTIPNSVTYIGDSAFSGCLDLVTVNMGSGIENVGSGAFAYTGVKNINWGSNVKVIESLAFANAELESVEIPNTVTAILYASFEGNDDLSGIKIPSSVKSVGSHAFDETAWYMAQNKGLTYVDNILYRYKGDVTEPTVVNIKDGTRLIADAAFEHMDPEIDDPEWFLPNSYYDLSGITAINIPNSVVGIGNLAFSSLPNITEITLPDKLADLGSFVFVECENLAKVNIGKATAEIEALNLAACYSIEEITVDPQNTKYTAHDGVLYNKNMSELIYCPPAKTGDLVVPASVEKVAHYAFSYNSLTSITFSNPDVDIDYQAFDEYYWNYSEIDSYYEMYSWNPPKTEVVLKAPIASNVDYYAANRGLNFEAVAVVEEEETGISISETVSDAIPEGATLVVESVESDEENTVVFDITLERAGDAVQPDAPVTVKIPLPAGIDANLCKVYRIEADGSKTDMKASVVNGNIYFTTDHFSLYVIESSFLSGDINGDGLVDLQDVVTLSQVAAEWEGVESIEAALDPNGDGNVDLQDVVHLAQFVAEWGVTLSDTPYSVE